MNKKGQYFLVAAVVIAGVVIGLSSQANSIKVTERNNVFFELGNEIGFETKEVLNYGIVNERDVLDLTKRFLVDYGNIAKEEVLFVYGDPSSLQGIYFYEFEAGRVGLQTGAIPNTFVIQQRTGRLAEVNRIDDDSDGTYDRVLVRVSEIDYNFELKKGQNFFFVIRKVDNGERLVTVG